MQNENLKSNHQSLMATVALTLATQCDDGNVKIEKVPCGVFTKNVVCTQHSSSKHTVCVLQGLTNRLNAFPTSGYICKTLFWMFWNLCCLHWLWVFFSFATFYDIPKVDLHTVLYCLHCVYFDSQSSLVLLETWPSFETHFLLEEDLVKI